MTERRSLRRRLTTFCALAFVSNQSVSSSQANHIATRWGVPFRADGRHVAAGCRSVQRNVNLLVGPESAGSVRRGPLSLQSSATGSRSPSSFGRRPSVARVPGCGSSPTCRPGFPNRCWTARPQLESISTSKPRPRRRARTRFRDGRFDLGWICSSFVDLALGAFDQSISIDLRRGPPCTSGICVSAADSGIRRCSATFSADGDACNDVVSLSGHYALRIAIEELGHDSTGSWSSPAATTIYSTPSSPARSTPAWSIPSYRIGRSRHERRHGRLPGHRSPRPHGPCSRSSPAMISTPSSSPRPSGRGLPQCQRRPSDHRHRYRDRGPDPSGPGRHPLHPGAAGARKWCSPSCNGCVNPPHRCLNKAASKGSGCQSRLSSHRGFVVRPALARGGDMQRIVGAVVPLLRAGCRLPLRHDHPPLLARWEGFKALVNGRDGNIGHSLSQTAVRATHCSWSAPVSRSPFGQLS